MGGRVYVCLHVEYVCTLCVSEFKFTIPIQITLDLVMFSNVLVLCDECGFCTLVYTSNIAVYAHKDRTHTLARRTYDFCKFDITSGDTSVIASTCFNNGNAIS